VSAVKYLVIVHRNGEPKVVYNSEGLSSALLVLTALIGCGERMVSIERIEVRKR